MCEFCPIEIDNTDSPIKTTQSKDYEEARRLYLLHQKQLGDNAHMGLGGLNFKQTCKVIVELMPMIRQNPIT